MARPDDRDDEPRDFLAVRAPRSLHITPQTPRGWRASLYWVLALLAPHVPLTISAILLDNTPQETWVLIAVAPILVLNGLTVWAMIRWMLNRADILSSDGTATSGRRRGSGSDPRAR